MIRTSSIISTGLLNCSMNSFCIAFSSGRLLRIPIYSTSNIAKFSSDITESDSRELTAKTTATGSRKGRKYDFSDGPSLGDFIAGKSDTNTIMFIADKGAEKQR